MTWTERQLTALILVPSAAKVTGIPQRTIEDWISKGFLTPTPERRNRRVTLGDVLEASKLALAADTRSENLRKPHR